MTLDNTQNLSDDSCLDTLARDAAGPHPAFHQLDRDRALVKRVQSGENRAFSELVTKYRRRVLKVSLRYTHHVEDAEDAAQDAFLKAHRAINQFRGDATFYSWLCRIAINSAKSIRSIRTRNEKLFEPMHSQLSEAHDSAAAIKDWATPEALFATEEIYAAINVALDSLCKEQRIAIMLRELHELSYAKVATAMACPVGTVRSRVFRAREAIDKQLRCSLGRGLGRVALKGSQIRDRR